MSNLSDIKRRLSSVKQTRQITGAMETVSIVKMRKATERYEKSRAYISMLNDMMQSLAQCEGADSSEFFAPVKKGKRLVIVISTDRGLCGGFDHDIFKLASSLVGDDTVFMPIGVIGGDRYKNDVNADLRFAEYYVADYSVAEKISDYVLSEYGKTFDRVSVVYSKFIGSGGAPTVGELLPLTPRESDSNKNSQRLFAAQPIDELYGKLLPLYVPGMIYGALINNYTSEQYARHAAMSAATDSADAIINDLSIEYNRARQSSVTSQLTEIVGANSALGFDGKGVRSEKRS